MTKISSHSKPEIVVAKDHVVICWQAVQRPASIAPSQWLEFWKKVARS